MKFKLYELKVDGSLVCVVRKQFSSSTFKVCNTVVTYYKSWHRDMTIQLLLFHCDYIQKFTVCADVDALELVLSHGGTTKSADVHGGYAIHYAAQMCGTGVCRSGDVRNIGVRVLQLLLSFGADVHVTDKHGRQPILWAASAGKWFSRLPNNVQYRYSACLLDFNSRLNDCSPNGLRNNYSSWKYVLYILIVYIYIYTVETVYNDVQGAKENRL